jgi:hypothetical protein
LVLESEDRIRDPLGKAYQDLAHGRLVAGYASAKGAGEGESRWIRLAAGSDGAPPDLIQGALALGAEDGLDDDTYWVSVGLAMRMHRDLAPLEKLLAEGKVQGSGRGDARQRRIWNFLAALGEHGVQADSERGLEGLVPYERGQAYSAAVIALGASAPPSWRESAKRLLFVNERPYFN